MRRKPSFPAQAAHQGVVLPMALIMLIIISFAGLMAARHSATFETFSNNMRTNQVSRVAAEDALRHCERIAQDSTTGGVNYPTEIGKIVPNPVVVAPPITSESITAAVRTGTWNTHANWAAGAANLITVNRAYDASVQTTTFQRRNPPTCIIQPMGGSRFLVTARGLSADAIVGANGRLTAGSEVWLQSILSPDVPTRCNPTAGQPNNLQFYC